MVMGTFHEMRGSDAASDDFSRLKLEPSWVLIQAEPWLAKLILPASTSTRRSQGPELSH